MPNMVLSFDLDKERIQANAAILSANMALCLHEIGQSLRMRVKRSEDEAEIALVEELQTEFYATLEENGVCLDSVIE